RHATPLRLGALLCAAVAAGAADSTGADALGAALLERAGIKGGVCEMPRAGDGRLAEALAPAGGGLVHGLAAAPRAAEAARGPALAAGDLGIRVMIEPGQPAQLPLADWLADLVVVADATDANLSDMPPSEVRRVLAPYRGVALVGNPAGV